MTIAEIVNTLYLPAIKNHKFLQNIYFIYSAKLTTINHIIKITLSGKILYSQYFSDL